MNSWSAMSTSSAGGMLVVVHIRSLSRNCGREWQGSVKNSGVLVEVGELVMVNGIVVVLRQRGVDVIPVASRGACSHGRRCCRQWVG